MLETGLKIWGKDNAKSRAPRKRIRMYISILSKGKIKEFHVALTFCHCY